MCVLSFAVITKGEGSEENLTLALSCGVGEGTATAQVLACAVFSFRIQFIGHS
jgi:hypothetical protein